MIIEMNYFTSLKVFFNEEKKIILVCLKIFANLFNYD
jgi:hypothetical protein